ncbi:FAD-binding oxidoreductase [Aquabacterium sp. J223]|uniref:FAD-binding oxidoreductase n=1 Tax=Aquabacterium sp. J223 TaxID=2898431 RepID=UPI0021ADDF64|nr:FAD-binding oxidoreductase [Aquabacterium sp. J223]UUX96778.1 FAD-binding oxidoreductase [Aquabacterium sp. J223]
MPVITTHLGRRFESRDGETLLDAALRHGLAFPYSCRTGRCSTCKGRLADVAATMALTDELGLSQAERETGAILTCVRTATADLRLEIEDLTGVTLHPAQTLPCRIDGLARLAPDVLQVVLRLPPASTLRYHPGQYVDVIGPGGLRRSYSLANAPREDRRLELHVREVPGGEMSRYWFEQAKVDDLLRLRGPLGTFFLRSAGERDLVFLATGTGIAPVKAIMEGLQRPSDATTRPRSVTVLWGGRRAEDLYWAPSPDLPDHRFIPVLSRADASWDGARGHVQQVLVDGPPRDWTTTWVYACGSDAMIHGARERLTAAGLPPGQFLSDAFVCSAPA